MTVLATVTDPDGRLVELTAERWAHILQRHPQMEPYLDDVLRAVHEPTVCYPDYAPATERFFLKGAGPEPWLRVVVVFKPDRAFVVTAFGQQLQP